MKGEEKGLLEHQSHEEAAAAIAALNGSVFEGIQLQAGVWSLGTFFRVLVVGAYT